MKTNKILNYWPIFSLSLATLGLSTLASSYAFAGPAQQGKQVFDEIVVTAQKRSENIQDVPISVFAMSGDSLKETQTDNTLDLQLKTPGLVFTTNGPSGQPYIRGVGTDILGAASDPSIAVNIDGVYLARPSSAVQEFFDVERVEVLKGPQGTLYGRNATGGAINIITRKPVHQFAAGADASVGNYDKVRTTGYINVPVGEHSAVRASLLHTTHDGYTQIVSTSQDPVNASLNNENIYGGRVQFLTEPSDNLSVLLEGDYTKENDSRFLNNRPDPEFASLAPALQRGAILSDDIRISTSDRPSSIIVKDQGLHGTIDYDAGNIHLKSITAYRQNQYNPIEDIDGTNLNHSWLTSGQLSKEVTQEFQISSSGPKLDWLVGAYYLHEKATYFINVYLGGEGNPALGLPSPSDNLAVARTDALNKTNAYAGFGQATYHLNQSFNITAGGRYSYEKKDFSLTNLLTSTTQSKNASWSSFTPKLSAQYYFRPDVMAYASITKGFKSGGFNADGIGEKFDPEKIWSYEAGLKATWLDSRLRTNLAGFYYDYTNLQVRTRDQLGARAIVANVGSAKIYGLEAKTQAKITPRFKIDVNASYLKTKIADDVSAYDSLSDANQNVGGNHLPRAPEWTISTIATYVVPVSSGNVSFTGEYRYQSRIYFDIFQRNLTQQKGYSLVNAQIQYNNQKDWYVSVWAKNITNEDYKNSVIYSGLGGSLDFYGPPRTYGVQAGFHF